ncbi:Protein ZINC INDUCED FACILITATOR-LIKE 1 [Dichanthelium oligosanthes]|uniref:Protein ZINC INDUCED FACILITATOR-LIKE 1 n=1 Tax=Dichanthelium oligosanthes TaxID=888268 RepID=A0A1E5WG42_9POAL|nr:Protein ZINC INDUCED FACILITATOR-LIKE 1 [Dichanthelium oligosanthes]
MGEEAPPTTPAMSLYVDGCPGCAIERRKETDKGIPYKELFFVAITTIASALPISSLFPFLYFMETLHKHQNIDNEIEMSSDSRTPQTEDIHRDKSLYKNWPLMSSIIAYCVFTLHDTAYSEALSIPLLAAFPFMTHLSGYRLGLALYFAAIVKAALGPQNQRGAANGIAATAMSFFKAIGPAGAGALFSWAQKRQHAAFFPGDQMMFFVLNVVQCIGLVLTFKPFLAVPEHYDQK